MAKPTSVTHLSPPTLDASAVVRVDVATTPPPAATAVGVGVGTSGPVPDSIGLDRDALARAGFRGETGQTFVIAPAAGPVVVAVGTGAPEALDAAGVRDAVACFARAASTHARLAFDLETVAGPDAAVAAHAAVEGVLLSRYHFVPLRRQHDVVAVADVTLLTAPERLATARDGAARGSIYASATALARDLANTPHSHLTATRLADLAVALGPERGIEVEVFDEDALAAMGCGGLLGINAGSVEPPRLIKLTYRPDGEPTGRIALVGKGIMYDSGGISLKPSDKVHAQMKNDMSGAAAVLAAVASLQALGCTTEVVGFLMCTDNMPSGTALGLGDVITIRNGTTVEVIDTDAEGRIVLADGLALAAEDRPDLIIDIATLTGSAVRALGTDLAAVFTNDDALLEQVRPAAAATAEAVWHLPLHRPYRTLLDSLVADIVNCGPIGLPDALLATLFLSEFVDDVPWVHIDMCGQAQNDNDRTWHPTGCTGFGARLLIELATTFTPAAATVAT